MALREERALDWILTAHTANDVAETFLMRCVANKQLGSIDECDERRRCLRPFLGTLRAEIDEYAEQQGLRWVTDPTNADTSYLRNRVRHELIPHLERAFDPSVVWSLAERAASLARDQAALNALAIREAEAVSPVQWESQEWLCMMNAQLAALPSEFVWRVVERLFLPVAGYPLGERKSRALAALLMGEAGTFVLDGAVELVVRSSALHRNR